ncbi:LysR substrate-binding domain-containing protein [Mesorhizobium sp. CAU 1741]|uniref:LysR substrate-binding domain-containing protein n=1 Tax=Mesorhizobium sp. CAU 1741 TaxID=3140366 RepID=UPI00325C2646
MNPLRAFAVASRHKTFTAAAEYMGVSQVAVSRQVSILEDYLNVKLFERGSRSVRLTHVGRAFSHEIVGLFEDLENATQRILANESDQTIRLRIYPTTAHYWLMPRLPDFKARYPEYRVRLDTSVEPLDFRGTHLDVAIQMGRGEWADARYRRLMDVTIDAVCSPSYLEVSGPLNTPRDLRPSDLLHARYRRREWEAWSNAVGVDVDHHRGLEFESSLLTYSAALSGMGIAMGQLEFLGQELADKRLVRPFKRPATMDAAFYIIWPTLTSVSTKARHFIDWVLEQAEQPSEFFKRRAPQQAAADD